MIDRVAHRERVGALLRRFPVVAIIGARQAGKTTLARQVAAHSHKTVTTFDLESAADLRRLDEPSHALGDLKGLVVLDEVQRRPELFPVLRVLSDRPRTPARFLVLGSASPDLLRQTSESLAGRIAYHELDPLSVDEVGTKALRRLWLRGGFPRSFLSTSDEASFGWRDEFIRTFLERDLPQLGVRVSSETLRRFWMMLAHYHGQIWNASEFGRAFGVSDTTVRHYLDVLVSTFVVRALPPWSENLGKRQVKSPKVYLRDSGLLHALLGLHTDGDLRAHVKVGASWEGFVLGAVMKRLGASPRECFFWATHTGAELDLLVVRGRLRRGFEVKLTDAPAVTPSMRTSLSDLGLSGIDVIHAGRETYSLAPKIRAVSASRLLEDVEPLG